MMKISFLIKREEQVGKFDRYHTPFIIDPKIIEMMEEAQPTMLYELGLRTNPIN
jgi:hypothetical protein